MPRRIDPLRSASFRQPVSTLAPRNRSPLQEILLRYGARLRALVETHCGRNQGLDADDIEQEVRIKLWKMLESDKTLDFPASYIHKVVSTTVIDALRRAEIRQAQSLEPELEALIDPSVQGPLSPERQAGHRRWGSLLLRCIAELPERRQLPVQLALQGFSADEIAKLTGCTVAAAQQLSYRGIEDLKIRLKELGADAIDE